MEPPGQEAGDMDAFGLYGSADYQFARRWFAGARYDWSERAYDSTLVTRGRRCSHLLAERVQPDPRAVPAHAICRRATANELLFQFLFSIGAHGAHPF